MSPEYPALDRAQVRDPEEIVDVLVRSGFHPYKQEVARTAQHHAAGGLWLGLDERTGAVASVIWVARGDDGEPPQVFVEVDGHRLTSAA
jgi:hypothetical protein